MAASSSSFSITLSLLPLSISPKPNPSLSFYLQHRLSSPPPSRIFAAMESQQTLAVGLKGSGDSLISVGAVGEKIIIKNKFGENLVGVLHNAGSKNLVILCHGFRSSKESRTLTGLADALSTERISNFRFDFSGNGESDGSFQYGNYWREVEDLRAVILFLSEKNYQVDAIAGHSKGGNVVLLYASKYHDISKVINVSGRFDLKRGVEERLGKDFIERIRKDGFIDVTDKEGKFMYRVTKESLEDRLSTEMRAACLSIDQNCEVLTIHGSEDDVVPPEDALEFSKLIKNHKLKIIEGADHGYRSHLYQLAETLLQFISSDQVKDFNIQ